MARLVADLGNSRMKFAIARDDGTLGGHRAIDAGDRAGIVEAIRGAAGPGPASWAIASVNPPLADWLGPALAGLGAESIRWFRSAAEVPIAKAVVGAETGGADRALAVLGALRSMPAGRPGRVVLCGTAITVERASAGGVWEGGSIAPGLGMGARAMHRFTAGLPLIEVDGPPPDWGRGTVDSMRAGLVWGAAGAIRELLARQAIGEAGEPWVAWSGGDSPTLAPLVSGPDAAVFPDLVLRGIVAAIGPGR